MRATLLATILLLAIACEAAPTETPVPTDTPAPAVTPTPTLAPTATPSPEALSAPVLAQRACTALQANNYDATLVTPTTVGAITVETSYGDGNTHDVFTVTDHEGVVRARGEQIRVDGVLYDRETEFDDINTWTPWNVSHLGSLPDDPLPCFEPNDSTTSEFDGGYHVTHIGPWIEGGPLLRLEYWTDAEGIPVRARRTTIYEESDRKEQPEDVTQITYSGIGEPNVITAPQ